MNYIGSKYSLLAHIDKVLDDHGVPTTGPALDLFAGTAAVAQLLKLRGHITYANDWQRYSYVTSVAFVELNHFPEFPVLMSDYGWRGRILASENGNRQFALPIPTHSIYNREPLQLDCPAAQVLQYLDQLNGTRGAFFEAYCETGKAGRKYFSRDNGMRIQAIRDTMQTWNEAGLLSLPETSWLVACLIESADRIANTASVYGAYLKHIKKSAQRPLRLTALRPAPSEHTEEMHRAFCEDGLKLLNRFGPSELELIYIDPPYNHRQYASNYHILETIARWDLGEFEPRGVTGLRSAEAQRSDFCLRSAVSQSFRDLFARLRSEYILFSYNNEGLLSKEELELLFDEFCTDVEFREIEYGRFRADVDRVNRRYKADQTQEYLILGRSKAGSANRPTDSHMMPATQLASTR